MKIIETSIRTLRTNSVERNIFSADASLWPVVDDIDLVGQYCLDRWQNEFSNESFELDGWQLKKTVDVKKLINEKYAFVFLMVSEEFYNFFVLDRNDIKPSSEVYSHLLSKMERIGFDVCDRMLTSIFSHGISPIISSPDLNEFGLFNNRESAQKYVEKNNFEISEHAPWEVVELYVMKGSKLINHNNK